MHLQPLHISGFPGAWSLLLETCFVGWSWEFSMQSPAVKLPGFGKAPAECLGDLNLMNSVVLLFTTLGRIFMHTHTRSRTGSCRAADSSRLEQWQSSPDKGLALPLEQAMLRAQLLPTVILPGTCLRPREQCWILPHPLCLCCACFKHYVKFSERMLCFFKAQGVSSL